jgi:hypothetical protein
MENLVPAYVTVSDKLTSDQGRVMALLEQRRAWKASTFVVKGLEAETSTLITVLPK